MAAQFKLPWMGVALPTLLIGFLGASSIPYMYKVNYSFIPRTVVQLSYVMLWFSYYLAITTKPGSPPPSFTIDKSETPKTMWYKYCVKCKAYKPERSHHCKTCRTCILKMDHHCPWTMNCVGYNNFPHFQRFLWWVMISISQNLVFVFKRFSHYYSLRDMPSYLISMTEMSFMIVNGLLSLFVFLTVGILTIRVFFSMVNDKTMIESWELERIEHQFYTEKFWTKVRSNYTKIYPDSHFPKLSSWKLHYREKLSEGSIVPYDFSFDDLIFPYDSTYAFTNMINSMGPFYQWMWPWGGPTGDGLSFIKDPEDEDQLKLPFPPDGSDFEPFLDADHTSNTTIDNEDVVKNSWVNGLGETLNDFGVDLETEHLENYKRK